MEIEQISETILSPFNKYFNKLCDEFEEFTENIPIYDIQTLNSLCHNSIEVLKNRSSLLELTGPIIVVGDIHGNIKDLVKIFHIFGTPPNTKYLFLGDYVDRGAESIAVISLILAFLCLYPDSTYLIRGNHEFSHINRAYGFYEEIRKKYNNEELWLNFQQVFNWLPLAATINNLVFCVHGGLSPLMSSLDDIRKLQLPIANYLQNTMISDLVWSDPNDAVQGFCLNHRGSGQIFGADTVETFLKNNKLALLVRAHQCTIGGIRPFANFSGITLFSSSDYCLAFRNKCGVISIKERNEISFYSLEDDFDCDILPKATMIIPNDGSVGLRRLTRTLSKPNLANILANVNSNEKEKSKITVQPKTMSRSVSVNSDLLLDIKINNMNNI